MSSFPPEAFVLVVDDDADSRELTQRLIDRAGFGPLVQTCVSGEDAEEFLAGHRTANAPAVVLLDLHMPGCSGFDVLEWIREHDCPPNLKVVMWSTSGDAADQQRAAELGATAYLTKFASSAILGAVIHECLEPVGAAGAPRNLEPADLPRKVADGGAAPRTKVNYQWRPAPMGQATWPQPVTGGGAGRA